MRRWGKVRHVNCCPGCLREAHARHMQHCHFCPDIATPPDSLSFTISRRFGSRSGFYVQLRHGTLRLTMGKEGAPKESENFISSPSKKAPFSCTMLLHTLLFLHTLKSLFTTPYYHLYASTERVEQAVAALLLSGYCGSMSTEFMA